MDKVLSKKVLYLTYDGLTDQLGQSQILPYLLGLAKRGYVFDIISFEKPDIYKNNRTVIEKLLHDVNITWYHIKYHKRPTIIATLYDILLLNRKALNLYRKNSYRLVHCRSYITSLVGLHLKKKYGLNFIFDMRGFWADERVEGGLWNLKNPLYKLIYKYFKNKERIFLENADYTISLTHNAKKEIHSWTYINNNPIPIEVIPCCVDTDLFNPDNISESDKEDYRIKIELKKDDFVLTYLGSIGTWYLLDEMLIFFKTLLIEKPEAKFLFITKGNPALIYEKAFAINIDKNSLCIYHAERKEVPILLSLSNYGIFFIKPSYSKKASSATKMAEIMVMGKPVITNDGWGDVDKIVNNSNGILVSLNDQKSIEQNLIDLRKFKRTYHSEIRKCANSCFSLKEGISKYARIYKIL